MTENRYDLRKELDGTWAVFDVFTGMPALVNEVEQVRLEMEQADDLVDLLNLLYIRRRLGRYTSVASCARRQSSIHVCGKKCLQLQPARNSIQRMNCL